MVDIKKCLLVATTCVALSTFSLSARAGEITLPDAEFYFGKAGALINADAAYSVGADGSSVLIAMADSGLLPDTMFPLIEMKDKGQAYYNFYDYGRDVTSYSITEYLHAHLVASLAVANRNGWGGQGIAYGSQLISYKIADNANHAPRSVTHVADMLAQVRADKAEVLSGAWGWMTYSPPEFFDRDFARSVLYPIAAEVALMGEYLPNSYRGTALVFAAGNKATPNPANVMALIPYWFPELQSKFITAVALDVTDWVPGMPVQTLQLASYSSQCGAAKDWCIAAPGHGIAFMWENGVVGYSAGTSSATGVTVGALAVLMDAFPEISAEDAIAIVLETATDIGAPGVDDVFGHGLLNLEAALQPIGPFSLATDGGAVSVAGTAFGSTALLGSGFSAALAQGTVFFQDAYGRFYESSTAQLGSVSDPSGPDLVFPSSPVPGAAPQALAKGLSLTAQGGLIWRGAENGAAMVMGQAHDRAVLPFGALPFDHIEQSSMVVALTESAEQKAGTSRWMAGIVSAQTASGTLPSLFGTWQYALNDHVSLQAGALVERGQLHGATGRGALAYRGDSLAAWGGASGYWQVGNGLTVMAEAALGVLAYQDNPQLGLTRLSGTTLKASVGFMGQDVIAPRDALQLSLGLPETIINGRANVKLPDRGFARRDSFGFTNTPDIEAKLKWSLHF